MHTPEWQILERHAHSLAGTLRARRLTSKALGIRKPYYVYEPPGYEAARALPTLYLFRGHQREWVNIREDTTRRLSTSIEDLDRLIQRGVLPPMLAVMPGLSSSNNHVPALGVDMTGRWPRRHRGLGRGRFWQFLTGELLPGIERRYPQTQDGPRLMAGFSLGGYTVSLLALRHPGYFDHAAAYDGLFMWAKQHDPRPYADGTHADRVWTQNGLFAPAFGRTRSFDAAQRWNPTDHLLRADASTLDQMRRTTFWIASADADGNQGNRDRCRYFAEHLAERGLPLGFDEVVLAPGAAHTWYWADRFLVRFLQGVFPGGGPVAFAA